MISLNIPSYHPYINYIFKSFDRFKKCQIFTIDDLQQVLQQDLDEKHDYQHPFQAPSGRRGWFRKTISNIGKFIKKNYKKIWEYLKKYHKCCTKGKCVGKKYCYTEWFKIKNNIGAQRYENKQKELLLREMEDADYDVYEDEKK